MNNCAVEFKFDECLHAIKRGINCLEIELMGLHYLVSRFHCRVFSIRKCREEPKLARSDQLVMNDRHLKLIISYN